MCSAPAHALGSPEVRRLFDDGALIGALLEVEAALAQAQAQAGLFSTEVAATIARASRGLRLDVQAIVEQAASAGSLAIPVVRALGAEVARLDAEAARWVHLGATSQDLLDTALVLQTRRALDVIDRDLATCTAALWALIDTHGHHPVLARTLMQPATVITLGLKLLNWVRPLQRSRQALQHRAASALQVQLGGPVGALGGMGADPQAVVHGLARHLALQAPEMPWQAQRDELMRLGSELGIAVGALAKIAQDLALLGQAEVGEVFEGAVPGRGGSSAMPHKRNPVGSMVALAAHHRAPARLAGLLGCMAVQHERGLGGWQAEAAEWCELLELAAASAAAMAHTLPRLELHPHTMRRNIEALQGLPAAERLAAAWAPVLGRQAAHDAVADLCRQAASEGLHLRDCAQRRAAQDAPLAAVPLEAVFDLQAQAAAADALVQRLSRELARPATASPS